MSDLDNARTSPPMCRRSSPSHQQSADEGVVHPDDTRARQLGRGQPAAVFEPRLEHPPLRSGSPYGEAESLIRARVMYFAQIGFHALEFNEPLSTRVGYTADYFKVFTGRHLADRCAAAFARHVQTTYGDHS